MKTRLNVLMVVAVLAMLVAAPAAQVQAEELAPMHVGYILLTWKAGGADSYTVTGMVLVLDGNYRPVNKAVVTGEWTLPDGTTLAQQAMTDRIGVAIFRNARDGTGAYTLCVTGGSKAGYAWAPGPNDCKSLSVP